MSLLDEARDHLETADRITTTGPMSEYHLKIAQTKAILAVAEQQRIANLIAVDQRPWAVQIVGDAAGQALDEIRKGLGL